MKASPIVRLESLDILRGFDLFCLVFFQPILITLSGVVNTPWMTEIAKPFEHVAWEGFAFWDIIMPLFLFMAGVSMPFAFSKYMDNNSKSTIYKRVLKRVLLLWIFGMMCQGNLLGLNLDKIFLYSNTLQAIAMGYLISALLLMNFKLKGQIITTSLLLLISWALLTFVKIGEWGGGNFSPDNNLAEYIDRVVLGRFRAGVTFSSEGLDFGEYRYTWILSSLNFGVTVMTGVFAGHIMKTSVKSIKKVGWLVAVGVSMIIVGKLWGLQMPIIKKIWTSSMTLYSSGICFLLMALFFYLIDHKKYIKGFGWLKIYGMNSIMAYMLYTIINFACITQSLFFGMEQYLGNYYVVLLQFGNVSIVFLILWFMHRNKIFLKI